MTARTRSTTIVIGFVLILMLLISGCSSSGTTVNVEMGNFHFNVDKASVPAGKVTFHVNNPTDAGIEHEMIVVKTDLKPNELPPNDEGGIDEDALESLGEVKLEAGKSQDLVLDLKAGHYILLCNEPGHYGQGMVLDFEVK